MQYRVGLVSVTHNSATVTGDTQEFLSNVEAGDLFTIVGSNVTYEIVGVVDDTTLTLQVPYQGESQTGLPYTIARDFTPNLHIPVLQPGDIETATILRTMAERVDELVQFDTDIEDPEDGETLVFAGEKWVNKIPDVLGTVSEGEWNGSTIEVAYGGTGLSDTPANGQLLIGNGTDYTLSTLTAGSGMSISNGAGSITITNNGVRTAAAGTGISITGTNSITVTNTGVTSLAGTTNQVNVSASTGSVTLSLPQSVATTSSPTFAQVTLSNAPTNASHAATKSYVDAVSAGLKVKESVKALRSTNLNVSNPGTSTFDGVTLSNGDRLLLIGQSTSSQNGIWVFNGSSSALTRPTDFNSSSPNALAGTCVFISQGTSFGNTFFVLTTDNPITVDTTSLTWAQFGGPGTYVAGSGLTLNGNEFSIDEDYVGQDTITTVGTVTTGEWNATAIDLESYADGVLAPSNGGTGVDNGSATITIGGNVIVSGDNTLELTTTGSTSLTLPTSGTLVNSDVTTLSSLSSVGTITTGTWNASTIAANRGGTGQSSYTVGDVLYANTTSTLTKLAAGTEGSVLTITSGVPSWNDAAGFATFANPLNTVGLTAKNGSALTAMRSDAAPALDQSISPTWTGTHTFNNAFTVAGVSVRNATLFNAGTLSDSRLSGNVPLLNATNTFSTSQTIAAATATPLTIEQTNGDTNLTIVFKHTSQTRYLGIDNDGSLKFGSTADISATGDFVSLEGHTHAASEITSGTFSDSRLSSNIPRLNVANTFSDNVAVGGTLGVSGDATFDGFTKRSTANGLTATGTTQGTALQLTKEISKLDTVGANTGVVLPNSTGTTFIVVNDGANALKVYPPSGGAIDALGTNNAFSLPVGGRIMFLQTSSTPRYFTLNATYA